MKTSTLLPLLTLLAPIQAVHKKSKQTTKTKIIATCALLLTPKNTPLDSEDHILIKKIRKYLKKYPNRDNPTHEKKLATYLNKHRNPHETYYTRKRMCACHPDQPRYIHFLYELLEEQKKPTPPPTQTNTPPTLPNTPTLLPTTPPTTIQATPNPQKTPKLPPIPPELALVPCPTQRKKTLYTTPKNTPPALVYDPPIPPIHLLITLENPTLITSQSNHPTLPQITQQQFEPTTDALQHPSSSEESTEETAEQEPEEVGQDFEPPQPVESQDAVYPKKTPGLIETQNDLHPEEPPIEPTPPTEPVQKQKFPNQNYMSESGANLTSPAQHRQEEIVNEDIEEGLKKREEEVIPYQNVYIHDWGIDKNKKNPQNPTPAHLLKDPVKRNVALLKLAIQPTGRYQYIIFKYGTPTQRKGKTHKPTLKKPTPSARIFFGNNPSKNTRKIILHIPIPQETPHDHSADKQTSPTKMKRNHGKKKINAKKITRKHPKKNTQPKKITHDHPIHHVMPLRYLPRFFQPTKRVYVKKNDATPEKIKALIIHHSPPPC